MEDLIEKINFIILKQERDAALLDYMRANERNASPEEKNRLSDIVTQLSLEYKPIQHKYREEALQRRKISLQQTVE